MIQFTNDELTLISLYDPGNRKGTIAELRAMMDCLRPDETLLRELAEGALRKLNAISNEQFTRIAKEQIRQMPLASFDNPHS